MTAGTGRLHQAFGSPPGYADLCFALLIAALSVGAAGMISIFLCGPALVLCTWGWGRGPVLLLPACCPPPAFRRGVLGGFLRYGISAYNMFSAA